MAKQVMLIHGGDICETYEQYLELLRNYKIDFNRHGLGVGNWRDSLAAQLGEEYQYVYPEMPNKRNARYIEWKIWFEKFFPFLNDDIVLVGTSLGGSFLAKYLSENNFPKKIKAVFLVAGAFSDNPPQYKLLDFKMPTDFSKLESQAPQIVLYHSQDDDVVPFGDSGNFKLALPKATLRTFQDKGHFNLKELPELVDDIKKIFKE